MQHESILPEGNLLPNSYASARRLIEPHSMDVCPKCNASRYKHGTRPVKKFIYLPVGPRLVRMFETKHLAQVLQAHANTSQVTTSCMYDIHDSNLPIPLIEYLRVTKDAYPLLFALMV